MSSATEFAAAAVLDAMPIAGVFPCRAWIESVRPVGPGPFTALSGLVVRMDDGSKFQGSRVTWSGAFLAEINANPTGPWAGRAVKVESLGGCLHVAGTINGGY